jgi:hypothetical protein
MIGEKHTREEDMIARQAAAIACAAITSLVVVSAAQAQALDDYYAKAKSEGAFSFYVGGPTAPWRRERRFSKSVIQA